MVWPVANTKIKKEKTKNAPKNVNFQNFEKQKKGPLNQKYRFLAQKMCSVARAQTDKKVKTEDTLSGLRIFSFNIPSRSGPIKENMMISRKIERS